MLETRFFPQFNPLHFSRVLLNAQRVASLSNHGFKIVGPQIFIPHIPVPLEPVGCLPRRLYTEQRTRYLPTAPSAFCSTACFNGYRFNRLQNRYRCVDRKTSLRPFRQIMDRPLRSSPLDAGSESSNRSPSVGQPSRY